MPLHLTKIASVFLAKSIVFQKDSKTSEDLHVRTVTADQPHVF